MAKMVYDERYGELTFALRAAIRKHNVSPADFYMLESEFGEGNLEAIRRVIVARSGSGQYRH